MIASYPPLLVTVEASDKIIQSHLTYNKEGFACTIVGTPSDSIKNKIFEFLAYYARGKEAEVPPLEWGQCPSFTRSVLEYLSAIPIGQRATYGEVALALGSPKACRAVGGACGRNPFPLFLPCHRVCGREGLGGFSEGVEIKKILIDFECAFSFNTETRRREDAEKIYRVAQHY